MGRDQVALVVHAKPRTGAIAPSLVLGLVIPMLIGLLASASASDLDSGIAVDLELVLAIDGSSSIDLGEYAMQLRGIAEAFRDADIQGAIHSGPHRRIAVNTLIWAQNGYSKQESGWTIISSREEAEEFASRVEVLPRRQFGGTAIGEGLGSALASLSANAIFGVRQVIDVSGDGRESEHLPGGTLLLPEARAYAKRMNVTVNGLAITDEDPSLFAYYQDSVSEGPDSFTLSAGNYKDIAQAMKIKLLREIQHLPKYATRSP